MKPASIKQGWSLTPIGTEAPSLRMDRETGRCPWCFQQGGDPSRSETRCWRATGEHVEGSQFFKFIRSRCILVTESCS